MSSSPNATPTARATTHTGRRRRGAEVRAKIADSTIVQGAIAGALSFTHIRDVALMGGQTGWKGWAYPLIVDMITMSAYRRLKRNQSAGDPTGVPWTWLIIGIAASISANIIDAIVHAPHTATPAQLVLCIIVGVWPAIAFTGSMLLRHNDKPTTQAATADRPAAEQTATGRPTAQMPAKPTGQPASRPTVQQPPAAQPATTTPPPIPVKPTRQPPFIDLGPRAAVGELPLAVWVMIAHPIYVEIRPATGGRPTETALHAALGERVAELVREGVLPPAVGKPSLSTTKRIRRAVEDHHPEVKTRVVQPQRQLVAATP